MFCLLSYSKACDTLVLVILVHSKHSTHNNCKFVIMKRNNEDFSTETPPKTPYHKYTLEWFSRGRFSIQLYHFLYWIQDFFASVIKFICCWTMSGKIKKKCLVLLLVPKCFVPVQIFWASQCLFKNFCASTKKQFYWMQIIILSGTKCLWLPHM